MSKTVIPFRMGDVVEYQINGRYWKKGEEHIIKEVVMYSPKTFTYSTDQGAWFEHSDFKLVREADLKSLTKLCNSLKEE